MSSADTKALIETAVKRFLEQVPSLSALKIVAGLELWAGARHPDLSCRAPRPEGHQGHPLRRQGDDRDPARRLQRARYQGRHHEVAGRVRRRGQGDRDRAGDEADRAGGRTPGRALPHAPGKHYERPRQPLGLGSCSSTSARPESQKPGSARSIPTIAPSSSGLREPPAASSSR